MRLDRIIVAVSGVCSTVNIFKHFRQISNKVVPSFLVNTFKIAIDKCDVLLIKRSINRYCFP